MLLISQLNNLLAPPKGDRDAGGPVVVLSRRQAPPSLFERQRPALEEQAQVDALRRKLRSDEQLLLLAALWADGQLTDDEFTALTMELGDGAW